MFIHVKGWVAAGRGSGWLKDGGGGGGGGAVGVVISVMDIAPPHTRMPSLLATRSRGKGLLPPAIVRTLLRRSSLPRHCLFHEITTIIPRLCFIDLFSSSQLGLEIVARAISNGLVRPKRRPGTSANIAHNYRDNILSLPFPYLSQSSCPPRDQSQGYVNFLPCPLHPNFIFYSRFTLLLSAGIKNIKVF